jgi:hypothetical protein
MSLLVVRYLLLLRHMRRRFGKDCGSFVLFRKCESFGGGFFVEFYPITGPTLTRRHVMVNSTCGICKAEAEDLMHALIECSHAKLFWTAAKEILLVKLPRLHPSTWARDILCGSLFPDKDIAIIISVMYSIWMSRNNVTHGEAVYESRQNPWSSYERLCMLWNCLRFK